MGEIDDVLDVTGELLDLFAGSASKHSGVRVDTAGDMSGRRLVKRLMGRRIDRHGEAVVAAVIERLGGGVLPPDREQAIRGAVGIAVRLGLLLIDFKEIKARQAWKELVETVDMEPAAEIMCDLLADTDFVPVADFPSVMWAWAVVAHGVKTVPEIMEPKDAGGGKPKRQPIVRPRPRR